MAVLLKGSRLQRSSEKSLSLSGAAMARKVHKKRHVETALHFLKTL